MLAAVLEGIKQQKEFERGIDKLDEEIDKQKEASIGIQTKMKLINEGLKNRGQVMNDFFAMFRNKQNSLQNNLQKLDTLMTDSERLKATISQISQNFAKKLKLLKQTQSVSEKEAQKYQNLKRKMKEIEGMRNEDRNSLHKLLVKKDRDIEKLKREREQMLKTIEEIKANEENENNEEAYLNKLLEKEHLEQKLENTEKGTKFLERGLEIEREIYSEFKEKRESKFKKFQNEMGDKVVEIQKLYSFPSVNIKHEIDSAHNPKNSKPSTSNMKNKTNLNHNKHKEEESEDKESEGKESKDNKSKNKESEEDKDNVDKDNVDNEANIEKESEERKNKEASQLISSQFNTLNESIITYTGQISQYAFQYLPQIQHYANKRKANLHNLLRWFKIFKFGITVCKDDESNREASAKINQDCDAAKEKLINDFFLSNDHIYPDDSDPLSSQKKKNKPKRVKKPPQRKKPIIHT